MKYSILISNISNNYHPTEKCIASIDQELVNFMWQNHYLPTLSMRSAIFALEAAQLELGFL